MTAADSIFAASRPRVFTIDPGAAFLKDLAAEVIASLEDDPFALSDTLIYLPTRRAVRALADAFIDASPRSSLLMPRMRALGDINEEDALLFEGDAEDDAELPPAISALERMTTLAQFVAARDRNFAGQENWPAAIAAARELAKLLDSFYTEEVSFDLLKNIAPQEFADHWKISLQFLSIVTEAWPAHLEERALMDPAARRVALINRQNERWLKSPPETPIIVAGTTGSVPAVARLIKTVASLPQGVVVLPGLDRQIDGRARAAIDDPHPQAGLQQLLREIDVAHDAVRHWPSSSISDAPKRDAQNDARTRLLSLVLRPANATDDWRDRIDEMVVEDAGLARATDGMTLVEADNEEDEATAIAIRLRLILEAPGDTAMLVTPSRNLARRVSLKMRRWGAAVDDSGGIPLANSPCGLFLRLTARWLSAPDDPVALLSLLRHSKARFGLSAGEYARVRALMDEGLRGLAPAPGVDGLKRKLETTLRHAAAETAPLIDRLGAAIDAWNAADGFADRLAAHLRAAENFAAGESEEGADILWRGEDGETAARLTADLGGLAPSLDRLNLASYADVFEQLIASGVVRRRNTAHPRLAILGPLEARLQFADHVILGGLNEGEWPAEAGGDPFLSRPMRADIGLPSPERRIGLAAHDFAQLASAPDVMLTRSKRSGGAPTRPSRWLVRLANILTGAKALANIDRSADYRHLAQMLDAAGAPLRIDAPCPKPPVSARPRALSVTRIEKWLRDPYAIYASYILDLQKLEEPGEPFAARHLGVLMHKIFEVAARNGLPRGEEVAALWRIFDDKAGPQGFSDADRALWRRTLDAAFEWYTAFDREQRRQGATAVVEQQGAVDIETAGAPFTLKARADRIDRLSDGALYVFDYKSRGVPTRPQTEKFSPQLPLTAHIAANDGFAGVDAGRIAGFAYLRVLARRGPDSKNEMRLEGSDAADVIADSVIGLRELVEAFDKTDTPYLSQPRPEYADDYGDFDQLARRGEWAVVDGDDDLGGET